MSTEILPLMASCMVKKRQSLSIIVYDLYTNNVLPLYGSLQRSKDRITCEVAMIHCFDSAHHSHGLVSATFCPL